MKKLFASALIMLATACGSAQESSVTAVDSYKHPVKKSSTLLQEGDYLITFESHLPCYASEFTVEKSYVFQTFIPQVVFNFGERVRDDQIRPLHCPRFAPPSTGTAILSLESTYELSASDIKIVSIEKITRSAKLRIAALDSHTLAKGNYILHMSGHDDCNAGERNVKKFNDLAEFGTDELDAIELSFTSFVGDDLIRAAVCRPGPVTAKVHVELDEMKLVRTNSEDVLFSLEIIQETESVLKK